MEFEKYTKKSFVLLGMEGSVHGDPIIILKLWKYANLRHERIEQYIIRNEEGKIDGVWGAKVIFPILLNLGKIITPKEFTLRGWNA